MIETRYYIATSQLNFKYFIDENLNFEDFKKSLYPNFQNKKFNFVSKESFEKPEEYYFSYPNILASIVFFKPFYKKYRKNLKELFNISKDTKIMIDSGGFSIAVGKLDPKKFTAKEALELSVANGDIFPILDIPSRSSYSFEDCLKMSYENGRYYSENHPGDDFIVFNVLHGDNRRQMEIWADELGKLKLDGWGIGGVRGNFKKILYAFFILLKRGFLKDAKILHSFGVSSPEMILYFEVLKECLNRNKDRLKKYGINDDLILTYDSSYPIREGVYGGFFMFDKFCSFERINLTNSINWDNLNDDIFKEGFICDCPICSDVKSLKSILDNKHLILWISNHNIYKILKFKDKISALVRLIFNVEELDKYIFSKRYLDNINILKEIFLDIDNAEKKIEKFSHGDVIQNSFEDLFV